METNILNFVFSKDKFLIGNYPGQYTAGLKNSPVAAHWLSVAGDHTSNPGWGEKFSDFLNSS